jgi:hypothetical protein
MYGSKKLAGATVLMTSEARKIFERTGQRRCGTVNDRFCV